MRYSCGRSLSGPLRAFELKSRRALQCVVSCLQFAGFAFQHSVSGGCRLLRNVPEATRGHTDNPSHASRGPTEPRRQLLSARR